MIHTLLSIACHGYGFAALFYLAVLVKPHPTLAWLGRGLVGLGLVAHGGSLWLRWSREGELLVGAAQGLSTIAFLALLLFLILDLVYRRPVMGAFVTPLAVSVLLPGLLLAGAPQGAAALQAPLLPVHVLLAVAGVAAFAVAAGIAGMYLLMEREAKRKRFGLLFERLPSLQFLDDLHRRLVLVGFVVLSLTLLTGAFFARDVTWITWGWKAVATVGVWLVFAAVLQARLFGGWHGRRLALLTMAGFCVLLVSFLGSYNPGAITGGLP